jgi:hypothetical protein
VERIYDRWARGRQEDSGDYELPHGFRYISLVCRWLRMTAHLNARAGNGGDFSIAGVNPLLLEPLLSPRLFRQVQLQPRLLPEVLW